MKLPYGMCLVLTIALTAHSGLAQEAAKDARLVSDLGPQVAAARCAYISDNPACAETGLGGGIVTVAQAPRGRMSRPPIRQVTGYPPPRYRMAGEVSGRHVAIGAIVGLTFGALIGSKAGTRAALGLGLLGSGIGAGIGASVPAAPRWRYQPGYDPDDDTATQSARVRPLLTGAEAETSAPPGPARTDR